MGGICSLGVVASGSSSDEEACASYKQSKPLQPVAQRQSNKTAPETVPSPVTEESALRREAKSGTAKASQVGTFFSRTCTEKSGKSTEFSSTVGATMSTSKPWVAVREGRIEILAFEVANTVVRGSSLMQAVSESGMRRLKEAVLRSEGTRRLVSDDPDELLVLVEADMREEFRGFSAEVVQFGNRCKDSRWHNLDWHFSKLEPEPSPRKHSKEAEISKMRYLIELTQRTSELYQEMRSLDKFERDYRRDFLQYVSGREKSTALQTGITLPVLWKALSNQRNDVANLRKKSLWCKNMDDIVEKLVDVVHFVRSEINRAFLNKGGDKSVKASSNRRHTSLGSAGLALHYANVIVQINTLALVSPSFPDKARDALYQALPPSIKSALQTKLQSSQSIDKRTVVQIRVDMDRTLQWLVRLADATRRLYHSNGTLGEWAMKGDLDSDGVRRPGQDCQYTPGAIPGHGSSDTKVSKIETLYHANKERTEAYILDLVLALHRLVCKSRAGMAARINHKSANGFDRSTWQEPEINHKSGLH